MRISETALRRLVQRYARRKHGDDAPNWRLLRATPGRGSYRTHWLLVRYVADVPDWSTEELLGRTTVEACLHIWCNRNVGPASGGRQPGE